MGKSAYHMENNKFWILVCSIFFPLFFVCLVVVVVVVFCFVLFCFVFVFFSVFVFVFCFCFVCFLNKNQVLMVKQMAKTINDLTWFIIKSLFLIVLLNMPIVILFSSLFFFFFWFFFFGGGLHISLSNCFCSILLRLLLNRLSSVSILPVFSFLFATDYSLNRFCFLGFCFAIT